jgi:hypothetical protein
MSEFKFPDEIDEKEPVSIDPVDIEVEIIDDTPAADRGREPLPQEMVKELEDDDLEQYSDKVKKRLGQMKKVWHDERREKERASREREEALRVAQSLVNENNQLKQRLGHGEQLFVNEITKSAANELEAMKEQVKKAFESGDSDAFAEAQENYTEAKLKLKDYQRYKPALQRQETSVEQRLQAQAPQQVADPKAEKWRESNTWFGTDEEMTSLALGLHEKLVRSGVDPRSDDYYQRVDETMRKRFPENFADEAPQTRERTQSQSRKAASVVAPATRSTAPRKVQLTQTQMALAKKLGVSPEIYAKEVIKLENYNG